MGPEYGAAAAVEKKIMQREELKNFLTHNIIEAKSDMLTHCVDGRYAEGAGLAQPGADAGFVMIASAALKNFDHSLSRQDILDSVITIVGGVDKFSFHTDSHAEHDHKGAGMGCGHLKLALNNPDSYGVDLEDMQFLMNALPGLIEDSAHMDTLEGEHEEQAVIVVDSEEYSLSPKLESEHGLQEVFVFQKTLHDKRLEELTDDLITRGLSVSRDDLLGALRKCSGDQLMETVGRLAKDLPVYTVHIKPDKSFDIEE